MPLRRGSTATDQRAVSAPILIDFAQVLHDPAGFIEQPVLVVELRCSQQGTYNRAA